MHSAHYERVSERDQNKCEREKNLSYILFESTVFFPTPPGMKFYDIVPLPFFAYITENLHNLKYIDIGHKFYVQFIT